MKHSKHYIGRKLRSIRRDSDLSQAVFAEKLGLSTSYLNQLENNQRPVTATVLLALAESFGVDITSLAGHDDDRLVADLREVLADPVFQNTRYPVQDIKFLVSNLPEIAKGIIELHQRFHQSNERLLELDDTVRRSDTLVQPTPYEEVRDFFHYRDNYIHALDKAAEALAEKIGGTGAGRLEALKAYIETTHGVKVELVAADSDRGVLRRYSSADKTLKLSAHLHAGSQFFHLAHQLALFEQKSIMDTLIREAGFKTRQAESVCQTGLANYFAGALLLPYEQFLSAAKTCRHDLKLLEIRFGATLEQVAHRLSTLQRPDARGIPFFFVRVDRAGNITKRHSATKLTFARFGSACPLWNVYRAFGSGSGIDRQLAETPDGVRYLCLAAPIIKEGGAYGEPSQHFAIALGCEVKHASDIVYADDLVMGNDRLYEPIGISCRLCERTNCSQRAVPPIDRTFEVNPNVRKLVPYEV
ncbi:helix-turn-helix domain-containing protein [Kordiimonas pumila]|uniref:Short-chain fatty acyl-CoA regulator family protein n=1 Tax=Kordiimonas pumila TaxID=2161677 RepID=A0ABV7D4Y8_9PROT|nr:helix-turn-helix transcriptional regulator [Kordiimonas pumila]